MIQAARSRVFVDGNNVMRSRPDGWWRNRTGAPRRLIAEIDPLALGHGGQWTIVFDGRKPPVCRCRPSASPWFTLGMAARDGADDRIVELVHAHPHRAASLVYTSDAKLLTRLKALGTQVMGVGRRADWTPIGALTSCFLLTHRGQHRALNNTQVLIESWRRHFNAIRPHSSLGYRPPAPETIVMPSWPPGSATLRRPSSLAEKPSVH